jgi:glycosyltransferase involved in cell wall biosynthesis
MAADFAQQSGLAEAKLQVLPNPVDADAIRLFPREDAKKWPGQGPHLLAVGRLAHEKGFDLLLEAFSSFRLKFSGADLTIVGSGPETAALIALRRILHIETSVHLAGHVCRPESYFPGATLFVLSSRHEGLPNALLEAAAGGLPLVALPSSGGVVSLLQKKPGAWLAEEISSKALTSSLLLALESICPGQRFPHAWVEPFRMDRAIQDYESLIDETLHRQRR